jgi:cephalosporin hydroxylase
MSLEKYESISTAEPVLEGQKVLLTAGEYSDYAPIGLFVAQLSFTPYEALEQYLGLYPEQAVDYKGSVTQFVSWMALNGYIRDEDCRELHLGTYGKLGK